MKCTFNGFSMRKLHVSQYCTVEKIEQYIREIKNLYLYFLREKESFLLKENQNVTGKSSKIICAT